MKGDLHARAHKPAREWLPLRTCLKIVLPWARAVLTPDLAKCRARSRRAPVERR